jgi:hypothetical protein
MIFDLCESHEDYELDEDYGYQYDKFLLIGLDKNRNFVSAFIQCKKLVHHFYKLNTDENWDMINKEFANFVFITQQHFVVDICEKFGYDFIVKWIRDNN